MSEKAVRKSDRNEVYAWIALLIAFVSLSIAFGVIVRRRLRVERKFWFANHYINGLHRKLDWTIRIVFIFVLVGFIYSSPYSGEETILQSERWFLLPIPFLMMTETVRAVMEWKYDENRKAYLATILEMLFMLCLVLLIIGTDFFGII
ncbi:DUF4181 domain-containing protein [Bacillus sp. PK3_68]|uniref:DUF4181 domain-containing protein n=1 Tax=Bacillus sp. PK3_68 TaxID=2027408 RepID=UPI000E72597D|nr:DUF4181 domain-containing protein [Bacillus sp. PK3_68]RJS50216.1 hypothetical protein CJ483_23490 [Bacillus sp. PK3_68]